MNYWITKSGQKMLVSDMNDQHIINAVKMLSAGIAYGRSLINQVYIGESDYAADAVDCENRHNEMLLERAIAGYNMLMAEARKRHLTIPGI